MRIILDCDPGIDDTYALIHLTAAAHTGDLELECVTTTAGNVEADQCARNAAWILSLCTVPWTPLAAGIPEPLGWELTTTPDTHATLAWVTRLPRASHRERLGHALD
nr:preQ1-regulated inosine-uridine nucleoside hydrolase [Streptococcus thermophilus]